MTVKPVADDIASPAWLRALRERRWSDAEGSFSTSDMGLVNQPGMRLAYAFALFNTGQFGRAWALLQDLEKDLPELAPQVLRLRAEAALHTQQAASAAEWLAGQGEPQAYIQASKTFVEAKNFDSGVVMATRAIDLLTPLRDDASRSALADAHRARALALVGRGATALAANDWLWLQTQSPTHPAASGADMLWEVATGQRLGVEQRLTRAVALAKAGMLVATEAELEQIQKMPHAPLAPGYSDWLLGKARSRARVEHLQGARMLERAVVAHVEDADSLRLEAARLYLRGGKEREAIRLLESTVGGRGQRWGEAQTLVARARGIIGDYPGALRAYDALLGKNKPKNKDELSFEQAVAALLAGQPNRALPVFDAIAQSERRESLRSRAAELSAVALLEAQRRDEAIARFSAVVSQYPFTLGAWLAAERLKSLQGVTEASPVPAERAPASNVLTVELPHSVATLHDLGLVDFASAALTKEEPVLRHRLGHAAAETMCKAYGVIGTAERRYAWSREGTGNLDLTQLPNASSRWRWDCRFPQPYAGIIRDLDEKWHLPRGLLYAVMRQESSFRERIQSNVGAVGLTQLLPKTADRLMKEFGPVASCGGLSVPRLSDPRCNLELGARYLHALLEAFDGQLVLAVLSYNAGPEMVNRWVNAKKALPLDLFLAEVPFPETRNYAHHVLTNLLVYRWLASSELGSGLRPELLTLAMLPSGSTKPATELY